jgi:hypothetical protein
VLNVNKKLTYLKKHHGFQDGELSEISKFYHGEPFDETEAGFLRLKALSENLCKSYSLFDKSLPNPTSLLSIAHHYLKRRHLLKAIFLGCHFSADIRPDFRCLIGQVDLVGTCFINQGIRVAPHALVRLENNAILGPNVVLGDEGYGKIVVKNNCWVGAGGPHRLQPHPGRRKRHRCRSRASSKCRTFQLGPRTAGEGNRSSIPQKRKAGRFHFQP